MKRIFSLFLTLALALVLVGCGAKTENKTKNNTTTAKKVYNYAEFMALSDGTENVMVESYILGKTYMSSYHNVNLYLGDENGGFYVYRMPVADDKYDELVVGQKVRITGTKTSWGGEAEFEEGSATYEMLEGTYTPTPLDLTAKFTDNAELIKYNNYFVEFKDLTVVAQQDAAGAEKGWLYKWNGSGTEGDDLYVKVKSGETTYSFLVESDLCNADTAVYQAVKTLKPGESVSIQGFLFYYENQPNLHITSISKVYTYNEFMSLKDGTENVMVESYILGKTYKNTYGNVNLYLGDENGGFYVYRMPIADDKYDELVVGQKVRITGTKTSWGGEAEFEEGSATYKMLTGTYTATPLDLTAKFADNAELIKYNNCFVEFKNLTVVAQQDAAGAEKGWLYKWNGSGAEGDDLYVKVKSGETTYSFLVESDLCNADTDVYKAVKTLNPGDNVIIQGFLFYYENQPNLHITSISIAS